MKLISCPACERVISAQAEICPGCGQPIRLHANRKSLLYLIIAMVVGGWMIYSALQKMAESRARADQSAEMLAPSH